MKKNLLALMTLCLLSFANIYYVKGQGATCIDPYIITSLPFSQTGMTTNGFGDDYDENLNDIARNSAPEYWDGANGRLLTTDFYEHAKFRNQLRYLHISWNIWYLDLLDQYQLTLDSLILEIESYLQERSFESNS